MALAKRIYSASYAVKQMDSMDELTATCKIILNNGGFFSLNYLKPHMLWGLPSFTSYSCRARSTEQQLPLACLTHATFYKKHELEN